MKMTSTVAKYLLGLTFLVFGLNGFLNFIPQPAPTGLTAQFMAVMAQSHYFYVIFAFEILGGVLLLATPYVALGLTVLAPLLVNILAFHICIMPEGLPPGILATLLWFLTYYSVRGAFTGLFQKN